MMDLIPWWAALPRMLVALVILGIIGAVLYFAAVGVGTVAHP